MRPNLKADKIYLSLIKKNLFKTTKKGKIFCAKTGKRLDKLCGGYRRVNYKNFIGIQAHRFLFLKRTKKLIPSNKVVNHKDFNKQNNAKENLELVTYGENNSHYLAVHKKSSAWRDHQSKLKSGEKNAKALFSNKKVENLRKEFAKGKVLIANLAEREECSILTMKHLLSGKTYTEVKFKVKLKKNKTGRPKKFSSDILLEWKLLRSNGGSFEEIAKKYNTHKTTVCRKLAAL